MSQNMCWCVWVISLVTLALVDSETDVLTRKDVVPRRCFTCPGNFADCAGPESMCPGNRADCAVPEPSPCPTDRPFCGTLASSPNFTSTLVCVAEQLCSLKYARQKQRYEFTCQCGGDRCSRPFSEELRNELLNYASARPPTQNNSGDFTDAFFTASKYANVTKTAMYDVLTVKLDANATWMPEEPVVMTVKALTPEKKSSEIRHVNGLHSPRALALKQEATVPSDDDEDEGEGSGSYMDARSHKRPAPAPAAPSSHLPANENGATHLVFNSLTALPIILYLII